MGERFRESAWDNQLDTMLDDLQLSVQGTEGLTNGLSNGHTSHEYSERQNGNTKEVRERTTTVAGGNGEPYNYTEERQFTSSTTTTSGGTPMGSKRGQAALGNMEQHLIDEKQTVDQNMRGRSDSLVSDLSSIAKVRSVSKVASSTERHYATEMQSSTSTQQSIKKNISELDHLLNNLSTHSAAPSLTSSKPGSRDVSPSRRGPHTATGHASRDVSPNRRGPHLATGHVSRDVSPNRRGPHLSTGHVSRDMSTGHVSRDVSPSRRGPHMSTSHVSRTDERRERLLSNASQYRSPSMNRTPSQSRPHSPQPSVPQPGVPQPRNPEPSNQLEFNSGVGGPPINSTHITTSTMRSNISQSSSEFRPVHTIPDPLTGRYPDGRITPNHGYTRNFSTSLSSSPLLPRKAPGADSNIPKKPDELLSSLGQEVDQREMARITQEENISQRQTEMTKNTINIEPEEPRSPTKNTAGPPVYYPTGDLYTKKEEMSGGEAGEYFSASYAREKGSKYREEKGEKGGAAVIPICLPLCCAAPCVIL